MARVVASGFGGLIASEESPAETVRRYRIERFASEPAYRLSADSTWVGLDDEDDVLFCLDKDITLSLQRQRLDLFFLHAAAVARADRAIVLPAFSGAGKSTLTLALVARGFDYLSDELAPIDVTSLTVEPYRHALCLKSARLFDALPAGTRRYGRRLHVPVEALPLGARRDAFPLAAVVFPGRTQGGTPDLQPISPASAAARLMAHALNPLAHAGCGLDAAIELSRALPCFEINTSDLDAAAAAIAAFR